MSTVDQVRIDANWRAIAAELDAPKPVRVERALRWLRVPPHVARIVVATPALRRSWYLSILAVVVVGLGAADAARPETLWALLVLAPLLPVLGVGMAYGTAADPSHEIQLATPTSGLRLVAIRSITVLIVSMVVVLAMSLLNEAARPMAAAWLLPAVAVTSASLAVMTVRPPRQSTVIVGVAWLVAVLIAQGVANDQLAAFRAAGQVASVVVALAAAAVVVARRSSFERLEYAG